MIVVSDPRPAELCLGAPRAASAVTGCQQDTHDCPQNLFEFVGDISLCWARCRLVDPNEPEYGLAVWPFSLPLLCLRSYCCSAASTPFIFLGDEMRLGRILQYCSWGQEDPCQQRHNEGTERD